MVTEQDSGNFEPTFRYARPEDLDEVLDLIQLAFGGRWPNVAISVTPIDHLKWKLSGPRALPRNAEVVEIDGRIVGYTGGSSRDWWFRGRRVPGLYGGDYCIHPEFQGRRLTTPWRNWSEAQFEPDTIGLNEGSTNPRLIRSSERRDERALVANKVDRLMLPLDIAAIVRSGDGPGGVSARSLFRTARTVGKMLFGRVRRRGFSTASPTLRVKSVTSFDERVDRLWERTRDAFDLILVRDRQHLNWRYCDPRAGVFRVRAVEDGDELAGFMVTGSIGRGAQIADLLAVPGDESALRALVEDAIAQARSDGAASLTVLMPRVHPYRETFLRYGFIRSRQVTNTGYSRRAGTELEFLETDRSARFHIAFGDHDHI